MKIYEDNAPEYTYCSVWLCNLVLSLTNLQRHDTILTRMGCLR